MRAINSKVDCMISYQLRWTGKPVKAEEIRINNEVVRVSEEDGVLNIVFKPCDSRLEGFYTASFLTDRAREHARKNLKVGQTDNVCLGTESIYPASTDTFEEGWFLWREFGLGPKTDPKGGK